MLEGLIEIQLLNNAHIDFKKQKKIFWKNTDKPNNEYLWNAGKES